MNTFFLVSAVVLLSAVSAVAQDTTIFAQQYDTGTVGLAPGQTAKLNVLYPAIPAPLLTQVLCSATLSITDDQNNVLKTVSLDGLVGGKNVSLDVNADTDLPSGTTGRVQLHGTVQTPGAGCNFVSTLELVDNSSGRTTVVVMGQSTWSSQVTANVSRGK